MADSLLVLGLIAAALVALAILRNALKVETIYPPNVGLLYRSGRFQRELEPGRYTFFDPFKLVRVLTVTRAPLPVHIADLTVISRDQFSFRLGLSPVLEVVDARAFTESQPIVEPGPFAHFAPQLFTHPALQATMASAALEVVAENGLRDLFADPKLLPAAVQAKVADAIPGARIDKVLMTSITLPPETRKMFTEVERSKLEAEAALERARGEQAALRALANAARLLKDNPALANLRFLQTLEQAPGAKTIVLGANAIPMTDLGGSH